MKNIFYCIVLGGLLSACSKPVTEIELKNNSIIKPKTSNEYTNVIIVKHDVTATNDALLKEADYKKIEEMVEKEADDEEAMTYEEKMENILAKFNCKRMTSDEINQPGISDIEDLINKVFDMSRPLSSNDIENIKSLDPYMLFDIADLANKYMLNYERIRMLFETCLDENNPIDLRSLSAKKVGCLINGFSKNPEEQVPYFELTMKYGNENPDDGILVKNGANASVYLSAYYWNSNQYEKCIDVSNWQIQIAEQNPGAKWAGSMKGGAVFEKINSMAKLGEKDQALKYLEQAKSMDDISEQYKIFFASDKYKDEIINIYGK